MQCCHLATFRQKKKSASGTLPGGIVERTSVFSQPDRLKLVPGFLLRILWCSESGNHPENNFAIFGDIIDMKVEKNRILPYVWLPTVSCHKTLAMWNWFSWKSGEYGPFFPMYRSKSYFSGRSLEKTLAVNETLNCLGPIIPPNSKQSLPNNYVVSLVIRCSCKQTQTGKRGIRSGKAQGEDQLRYSLLLEGCEVLACCV
jgi:hypothetical protein